MISRSEFGHHAVFPFPASALDEVADALVLEVQHREVELELLVVAQEVGLFEQLSAQQGQDLDHLEVGASADHALETLRTDSVIDVSYFFSLPQAVVFRVGHVSSPGAVDVLPLLHLIDIHAFDQLSALTFQLTEKRDVRLLVTLLLFPILADLIMHQTAHKSPINDVNLLIKKSTKLMTALGIPSLLT